MLPTLRLGFLIAPASLQPALRTAKQLTDWHGELPTEAALARFVDDGSLARHIRKVAREYAKRHARICEAIERDFSDWLSAIPSAAGLHVAAYSTAGRSIDLVRCGQARRGPRSDGAADISVLHGHSGARRAGYRIRCYRHGEG